MIWQAVVSYDRDGKRNRHSVTIEADSFQQARELLLAEYGPESINVGPRLVTGDNNE